MSANPKPWRVRSGWIYAAGLALLFVSIGINGSGIAPYSGPATWVNIIGMLLIGIAVGSGLERTCAEVNASLDEAERSRISLEKAQAELALATARRQAWMQRTDAIPPNQSTDSPNSYH